MKYINPDKIDLRMPFSLDNDGDILIPLSAVKYAIATAQTEDVERVVRCKHCKYSDWTQELCHGRVIYRCELHGLEVNKNFYCANGEKRDCV